jgi:hypothetical protein
MLWQAAANAASVAGIGSSSVAGGDGAICEGCGYSSELPDTTAVLMSLVALYPGLRKLEVYTKVGCTSGLILDAQQGDCACSIARGIHQRGANGFKCGRARYLCVQHSWWCTPRWGKRARLCDIINRTAIEMYAQHSWLTRWLLIVYWRSNATQQKDRACFCFGCRLLPASQQHKPQRRGG